MNDIQYIINYQLGNFYQFNYDYVLKRLVVKPGESYYGLQNNEDSVVYEHDPPIFACRFSEAPGCQHIVALANENGRVAMQDTYRMNSVLEGFQCHNNAVFDLAWMPGRMNFVTVSGDHTVCLWDVGESSARKLETFTSHTRSVKTAAFPPCEPHVFATGARDGNIFVWDTRTGPRPDNRLAHCHRVPLPDNRLARCHRVSAKHPLRSYLDGVRPISVTGLVFQDDVTLLSAGECDGNIKVWDLRRHYSVFKREPLPKSAIPYYGSSTKNGYTNLIVDDARLRLYASCMDNAIYCFNISTYNTKPEQRYVGYENATFYIKASLSPDSRYLVSGSTDNNAYVWNVKQSRPILRLAGHHAEVTCATWCADADAKIVTCGDDARHMVWRIGNELEPAAAMAAGELRARAERLSSAGATGVLRSVLHSALPSRSTVRHNTNADKARKHTCFQHDPGEPISKRPRLEGSLLRDSEHNKLLPAGIKRRRSTSEENTPTKKKCPNPSDFSECSSRPGSFNVTPSKICDKDTLSRLAPETRKPTSADSPTKAASFTISSPRGTPVKVSPTKVRILSFLENLPNFVSNGAAPHLTLMSPLKKKQHKTDWLTLMIREKRTKTSEMTKNIDTRRKGRRPKSNMKTGSLLNYFKPHNC